MKRIDRVAQTCKFEFYSISEMTQWHYFVFHIYL
jgi:hypothetical protein